MSIVRELQERRAQIAKNAQAELTKASQEGREFSAEEQAKFDRAMADVDSLAKQIANFEKLSGIESNKETADFSKKIVANSDTKDEAHFTANPKYNKAFDLAMRNKKDIAYQQFDLTIGAGDGGYLVGTEWHETIVEKMYESSVMRQISSVIPTNSDRAIPVEDTPVQAYLVAEGAAFTQSDPGYNQVMLKSYKFGAYTKVSVELLNDSLYPLVNDIGRRFGQAWGEASDKYLIAGTGVGQPKGVLNSATNVTTSGAATITFDDLISVYYSMKSPYRTNGTWIMNDTTVAAVRKIKDTNGQFIWNVGNVSNSGMSGATPDTILGRPVRTSPFVPAVAAGANVACLLDGRYFTILDRQEVRIQPLVEVFALSGMVAYLGFVRFDGALLLPDAAALLKIKSA